jgi:uncharacterized protein (TIGR02118 family)
MERWAILLLAPSEADPDVWNRRVLDLGCELAAAMGVEELAMHLRDEPAREIPQADVAAPPSFQALVELAGDQRARAALDALRDLGGPHVYRVERRRIKAYPRTWPDGARTPGVEMISPVRRAAGVTHEQFDAHWRDGHAPLALRHHVGMWEYRQNVVCAIETPGSPDFDGIAILGFPTEEDYRERLFDTPEGRAIIWEDIPRFLDLSRSESTFTGEYVLKS